MLNREGNGGGEGIPDGWDGLSKSRMWRAHPENGRELGGCNNTEQGCVLVRDETAEAGGSEHLTELFRRDPGSPQEPWKSRQRRDQHDQTKRKVL